MRNFGLLVLGSLGFSMLVLCFLLAFPISHKFYVIDCSQIRENYIFTGKLVMKDGSEAYGVTLNQQGVEIHSVWFNVFGLPVQSERIEEGGLAE